MASKNRLYLIKELESVKRVAVRRNRSVRIRTGDVSAIGLVFTKAGSLVFTNTCVSNSIIGDQVASLRYKTVR